MKKTLVFGNFMLENLKVALVCDWLTNFAGAERVILALHQLFPEAPIFTSVYNPEKVSQFKDAQIIPSFLQKFPGAKNHHQWYLKWMPLAFEQFDLSEFDLVISSSHSCAKGVITKPETLHFCYCHSPMRYVWDDCHEYLRAYPWPKILKKFIPRFLHQIRIWDFLAANRVDFFIANSKYVAERIKKYYRREAVVIYPPVEVDKFYLENKPGSYFLSVGRLIPYKKFNLAVEAFNQLGLPLKIVGTGVEEKRLKKLAHANIEFLDYVKEEDLRRLYARAQALIFPQCEDFGMAPVESEAAGRPVIAFKKGGALESVKEGVSGIFFKEQTADSLIESVKNFQKMEFDSKMVRKQAEKFSQGKFNENLMKLFESKLRA